jgi:hypothetical protein
LVANEEDEARYNNYDFDKRNGTTTTGTSFV